MKLFVYIISLANKNWSILMFLWNVSLFLNDVRLVIQVFCLILCCFHSFFKMLYVRQIKDEVFLPSVSLVFPSRLVKSCGEHTALWNEGSFQKTQLLFLFWRCLTSALGIDLRGRAMRVICGPCYPFDDLFKLCDEYSVFNELPSLHKAAWFWKRYVYF